ncbi:MAG: hypothetical protein Q8L23_07145 [Caulobacter sp.]|nr:hypothetical protein [Caulobacter sp.]
MAINFRRFVRAHPDAQVIEATDARQGRWGRHMFWVLVASTVLAVVALFGSWAFRAGDLAQADATSTPTAAEVRAAGDPAG